MTKSAPIIGLGNAAGAGARIPHRASGGSEAPDAPVPPAAAARADLSAPGLPLRNAECREIAPVAAAERFAAVQQFVAPLHSADVNPALSADAASFNPAAISNTVATSARIDAATRFGGPDESRYDMLGPTAATAPATGGVPACLLDSATADQTQTDGSGSQAGASLALEPDSQLPHAELALRSSAGETLTDAEHSVETRGPGAVGTSPAGAASTQVHFLARFQEAAQLLERAYELVLEQQRLQAGQQQPRHAAGMHADDRQQHPSFGQPHGRRQVHGQLMSGRGHVSRAQCPADFDVRYQADSAAQHYLRHPPRARAAQRRPQLHKELPAPATVPEVVALAQRLAPSLAISLRGSCELTWSEWTSRQSRASNASGVLAAATETTTTGEAPEVLTPALLQSCAEQCELFLAAAQEDAAESPAVNLELLLQAAVSPLPPAAAQPHAVSSQRQGPAAVVPSTAADLRVVRTCAVLARVLLALRSRAYAAAAVISPDHPDTAASALAPDALSGCVAAEPLRNGDANAGAREALDIDAAWHALAPALQQAREGCKAAFRRFVVVHTELQEARQKAAAAAAPPAAAGEGKAVILLKRRNPEEEARLRQLETGCAAAAQAAAGPALSFRAVTACSLRLFGTALAATLQSSAVSLAGATGAADTPAAELVEARMQQPRNRATSPLPRAAGSSVCLLHLAALSGYASEAAAVLARVSAVAPAAIPAPEAYEILHVQVPDKWSCLLAWCAIQPLARRPLALLGTAALSSQHDACIASCMFVQALSISSPMPAAAPPPVASGPVGAAEGGLSLRTNNAVTTAASETTAALAALCSVRTDVLERNLQAAGRRAERLWESLGDAVVDSTASSASSKPSAGDAPADPTAAVPAVGASADLRAPPSPLSSLWAHTRRLAAETGLLSLFSSHESLVSSQDAVPMMERVGASAATSVLYYEWLHPSAGPSGVSITRRHPFFRAMARVLAAFTDALAVLRLSPTDDVATAAVKGVSDVPTATTVGAGADSTQSADSSAAAAQAASDEGERAPVAQDADSTARVRSESGSDRDSARNVGASHMDEGERDAIAHEIDLAMANVSSLCGLAEAQLHSMLSEYLIQLRRSVRPASCVRSAPTGVADGGEAGASAAGLELQQASSALQLVTSTVHRLCFLVNREASAITTAHGRLGSACLSAAAASLMNALWGGVARSAASEVRSLVLSELTAGSGEDAAGASRAMRSLSESAALPAFARACAAAAAATSPHQLSTLTPPLPGVDEVLAICRRGVAALATLDSAQPITAALHAVVTMLATTMPASAGGPVLHAAIPAIPGGPRSCRLCDTHLPSESSSTERTANPRCGFCGVDSSATAALGDSAASSSTPGPLTDPALWADAASGDSTRLDGDATLHAEQDSGRKARSAKLLTPAALTASMRRTAEAATAASALQVAFDGRKPGRTADPAAERHSRAAPSTAGGSGLQRAGRRVPAGSASGAPIRVLGRHEDAQIVAAAGAPGATAVAGTARGAASGPGLRSDDFPSLGGAGTPFGAPATGLRLAKPTSVAGRTAFARSIGASASPVSAHAGQATRPAAADVDPRTSSSPSSSALLSPSRALGAAGPRSSPSGASVPPQRFELLQIAGRLDLPRVHTGLAGALAGAASAAAVAVASSEGAGSATGSTGRSIAGSTVGAAPRRSVAPPPGLLPAVPAAWLQGAPAVPAARAPPPGLHRVAGKAVPAVSLEAAGAASSLGVPASAAGTLAAPLGRITEISLPLYESLLLELQADLSAATLAAGGLALPAAASWSAPASVFASLGDGRDVALTVASEPVAVGMASVPLTSAADSSEADVQGALLSSLSRLRQLQHMSGGLLSAAEVPGGVALAEAGGIVEGGLEGGWDEGNGSGEGVMSGFDAAPHGDLGAAYAGGLGRQQYDGGGDDDDADSLIDGVFAAAMDDAFGAEDADGVGEDGSGAEAVDWFVAESVGPRDSDGLSTAISAPASRFISSSPEGDVVQFAHPSLPAAASAEQRATGAAAAGHGTAPDVQAMLAQAHQQLAALSSLWAQQHSVERS